MSECFAPVVDENSKILILGSFPSVKSREIQFYYGNKQNKIWKIFEEFFGEEISSSIVFKKGFLLRHKIAMWDVVKKSSIKGSGDTDLVKNVEEVNDIHLLLKIYPNIKKVFCNGKASEDLMKKYFPKIEVNYLPSTSPANVSFRKEEWFNALSNVK